MRNNTIPKGLKLIGTGGGNIILKAKTRWYTVKENEVEGFFARYPVLTEKEKNTMRDIRYDY